MTAALFRPDPRLAGLGNADWNLDSVVSALRHSRDVSHNIRRHAAGVELPSRQALEEIVAGLTAALFPSHFGPPDLTAESVDYFVGATLARSLSALAVEVRRSLCFSADGRDPADFTEAATELTRAFAARLPDVRGLLADDIRAAYHGDPAATSYAEILIGYPGMVAVRHHRLAHELRRLGAPFLAQFISRLAHARTGVDIHPGAQIGRQFFIDHGTGVVIGETAVIGNRVRLYHSVTLGTRRFETDAEGALVKGTLRHPILEDGVVVYAGATLLGRITIGAGSVIGSSVRLTHSVPAGSVITAPVHQEG
ncbi:serine O-acetyltransferase EpsC [Pseudoxanthobacter sp.]|uniref:serine O-acetyltransferase EpsC n=1 Tax=Pseudoxanthobacter sp. TaxID=1925742 RepID=UPI002FE0F505